ncbi:helix-hairpin-helix domain-containing protein [Chitinispirillales bacterium ANBcel5]|uniref:radical SAM protein n=1 Tax=Cellulosispirillum alkaliphilum TaxID=3039283 RepID=UPI002A575F99|nr:helix-hairpin-helix domain-containing protein [Chitinispirillales bacterium ANBcel5]
MDTHEKLKLLSDASRYDLSCACGNKGSDQRVRGNDGAWLYPVSLPRGGTSVMLKTLISNVCSNDCMYCPYRSEIDTPRCTIAPREMASMFMEYVRRKKVFGLFLSSGVIGTPDKTMEYLNTTAKILRKKHSYRGYIHLKIIPGASDAAIDEALSLSSAVSLNIEAPGENHFSRLSQRKDFLRDIIGPMKRISHLTSRGRKFNRVKQTTQFIVGAAGENDSEIVRYTAGLYERLKLNRVYFSAYQRGLGHESIPGEQIALKGQEGFVREHRLYQVDFLLRNYGFSKDDIIFDASGRLSMDRDPKLVWAQANPWFFPVNVNRAEKNELLRIPGIGPQSAKLIIKKRKEARIKTPDALPLKGKRLKLALDYLKF